MLLPLAAWAVTGAVFFVKPGYGAAYDALPVRTYPLEGPLSVRPDPAWREVRHLRTILGPHLLVRTEHRLEPSSIPSASSRGPRRRTATSAACSPTLSPANPARYGRSRRARRPRRDHRHRRRDHVRLEPARRLQQRGRDTDRIDLLYKVHYLQWTGQKTADKVLGLAGLTLLIALTLLGQPPRLPPRLTCPAVAFGEGGRAVRRRFHRPLASPHRARRLRRAVRQRHDVGRGGRSQGAAARRRRGSDPERGGRSIRPAPLRRQRRAIPDDATVARCGAAPSHGPMT